MQAAGVAQSLLQFETELVGASSPAETCFIAVNRLGTVMPYRLAVLLRPDLMGKVRIVSVSHLAEVDESAPFSQWLTRLVQQVGDEPVKELTAETVPAALAADWAEWLPEHAVLCRLASPHGSVLGWLLVAFDEQPAPGGLSLLQLAARQVALVLAAWEGRGWRGRWRLRQRMSRRRWVVAGVLLAGVLALPVRLSAVAPAEVTPLEPAPIAAPVEGVLAKFHVAPNSLVKAGDLIASIDDTVVRNRHSMAVKGLEIARAEFARAGSKAFGDDQSRSELLTLKARIDEKAAEVTYVEALLERLQMRAPVTGLVTYSSPDEWVGRPLVTGERIASVANPARVGLTLHLAADDAIELERGAAVEFYQNVSPLKRLDAQLTQLSYETETTVDAGLAYVLRAEFAAGVAPPRLGLRGSAKVYGERVMLGYYLLRRPFGAARRLLGL